MDHFRRHLRLALRSLRKRPGFSTVVILTLALGIGANTAVFSVLNSVLLRPLPYQEPERLVRVYEEFLLPEGGTRDPFNFLSGPMVMGLREATDIFQEVAAFYSYRELGADLTGGSQPQRVVRMPISADFFQTLGIRPALGRAFTRQEERSGEARAVISHHLWQGRFGGRQDILGQTVELDGLQHEIIGVAPRGFRGPVGGEVDVWTPEDLDPNSSRNSWGNHYLSAVARLAPGVTIQQAQARLRTLARNTAEAEGQVYDGGNWAPQLRPLHQDTVGGSRATLWVLMAAVALVLLSTCVNVANLFLVRSFSRVKELALRAALGSGRGELVGQLLSESLTLSAMGGLLGLGLAWAGVRLLAALAPAEIPRIHGIQMDGTVLLFTVTVSLLTGLAFGLIPALRLSSPNLSRDLREGSRGSTRGRGSHRLGNALVVSEVAVALVLLVGAGVLIRSFQAIQSVDLAMEPQGLLTYEVHLPDTRYPEGSDRIEFYRTFFPRIRSLPGVQAVGSTSWLPGHGRYHIWGFERITADGSRGDWTGTDIRMVDGEYFRALGIDLLQGRLLGPQDREDGAPVAVINRYIVDRFFGDEDPLGSTMWVAGLERTVVGVVENVPHDPFGQISPKVYVPHSQYADNRNWAMIQTVSVQGDPRAIVPALREELRALDPSLVLFRVRTMDDLLVASLSQERFSLTLMGIFAGMALLLATLGIFGVLSYLVNQRRHEIGIRMALGAEGMDIRRIVMGQGMLMVGTGIGLGIAAALYLSRWLRALVFQVEVAEPKVFGSVILVLTLTSWLAAYLPTRRATQVDPASAFRGE